MNPVSWYSDRYDTPLQLHNTRQYLTSPTYITAGLVEVIAALQSQGESKGLDTCCSATYMSQTRDQQRFTISELAA